MPRCFKAQAPEIYENLVSRRVVISQKLAALARRTLPWQPNESLNSLSEKSRALDFWIWELLGTGNTRLYNGSEIMRYPRRNGSDVSLAHLNELLDISGFKL
ncbi:hypothetical protein TWF718_010163 [Orbilia javanica]|uniref:Uncharacterized protein n=1 Tax=Orbilia javanica TaxID=47235 RepID=A0AAN8MJ97_9PEZI